MKRLLTLSILASALSLAPLSTSLSADAVYPEIGNPNPPYGPPGMSFSDYIYAQWYIFQNWMFGGPSYNPPPPPLGN